MTVESTNKAYEVAFGMIGAYERDEESTKRAGYSVYRSISDPREYICDLGNRLEVNTKDGKSVNIWIDESPVEVRRLEEKVDKQYLEILKLKARLYDLLCG